jgi:hypothetical protein
MDGCGFCVNVFPNSIIFNAFISVPRSYLVTHNPLISNELAPFTIKSFMFSNDILSAFDYFLMTLIAPLFLTYCICSIKPTGTLQEFVRVCCFIRFSQVDVKRLVFNQDAFDFTIHGNCDVRLSDDDYFIGNVLYFNKTIF